jgi:hypothetical protein
MARRSRSDSGFALASDSRLGGVGPIDQGMPRDHRLPEEQ